MFFLEVEMWLTETQSQTYSLTLDCPGQRPKNPGGGGGGGGSWLCVSKSEGREMSEMVLLQMAVNLPSHSLWVRN